MTSPWASGRPRLRFNHGEMEYHDAAEAIAGNIPQGQAKNVQATGSFILCDITTPSTPMAAARPPVLIKTGFITE